MGWVGEGDGDKGEGTYYTLPSPKPAHPAPQLLGYVSFWRGWVVVGRCGWFVVEEGDGWFVFVPAVAIVAVRRELIS